MKIIPPHIWDTEKSKNHGEDTVFNLLKEISIDTGAIALHSQNLIGGNKQVWSEIDFLIISNRAIIGLEVKDAVVSYREGKWRFDSEDGKKIYSKVKSPFVQVSDAVDTLRTGWFKTTFGNKYSNIPFVKLCVLCRNHRPDYVSGNSPPELPDKCTIYKEDLVPEKIKKIINEAIADFTRNYFHKNPGKLSDRDVVDIVASIRPEIDRSYASTSATRSLQATQNKLTEEQYDTIDKFQMFDRLLIDGGAGTGKTFLLAYGAMQELSEDKSVLIVAPHEKLRDFLKTKVSNKIDCVSVGQLKEIENKKSKYDCIYADEMQDLCNQETVDQFEKLLISGLQHGRWRFFGDFQNQFNPEIRYDKPIFEYLVDCTGNTSLYLLKHNVRNTPNIVAWLETICKARIGETLVKGAGPEVATIETGDFYDLLFGVNISPEYGLIEKQNSCFLYPERYQSKLLEKIYKLETLGIDFSTIEEFKGLEKMFVFVGGLEFEEDLEMLRDNLYKSVSRGRSICFVECNKKLMASLRLLRKM